MELGHDVLVILQAAEDGGRIAEHKVRRDQLVRHGGVAAIGPLLKVATDDLLVALERRDLIVGEAHAAHEFHDEVGPARVEAGRGVTDEE